MTAPTEVPTEAPMPPVELVEGLVDESTLRQLFADLEACTVIHEILAKEAAHTMIRPGEQLNLADALPLLLQRAVRGIQIRYTYQDREWWDTVLPVPNGWRIVRIQQRFD